MADPTLALVLGLLVGTALGFIATFLWLRARAEAAAAAVRGELQAELAVQRERAEGRQRQLDERDEQQRRGEAREEQLRQERQALGASVSRLETSLADERQQTEEKLQLLQQAREELTHQFKNLAQEILEEKSKRFTEQNQSNLDGLLKPLREQLKDFEKRVGDTYDKESKDRVALHQEILALKALNVQMSDDAVSLTRALKGDSKAQGSWGEVVLERVLEMSGLTKGREYETQLSLTDADGKRWQPDVVVHLPENRDVVIDSKVSLVAYERYCASDNEEARQAALREHLLSLRAHAKGLSARDYQRLQGLRSLDYVLMFVPIEAAFADAMRGDTVLFDEALKKNIIVVTPTTLLATLRAINNIWRYEDQSRNAQQIAQQAGKLYDKFVAFTEDLTGIGARLAQAQDAYQKAENKLATGRGNLVRQADQLRALGVAPSKTLPDALLKLDDGGDAQLSLPAAGE